MIFPLSFETINSFQLPCVISGDSNLPDTNWSTCESEDQLESNVINMFEENNFTQIVNFKTAAENVLDLVSIRNCSPTVAKDHTFDVVFHVCDQKAVSISFDLTIYETKRPVEKNFSLSRADLDGIGSKFLNHPLDFTCFSNINNMCVEF